MFSTFQKYYNSIEGTDVPFVERMDCPMTAVNELVNYLLSFTPEQLSRFLCDPVTVSILQPEEEPEPCLQAESL